MLTHCWEEKDLIDEFSGESGMIDSFSEDLKLSDGSDGELAMTDHFPEELSLNTGSDSCSENPKPNDKLRARGKICRLREPHRTYTSPVPARKKKFRMDIRRPTEFPAKPYKETDVDDSSCDLVTGGALSIAICTTPRSKRKRSIFEVNSWKTFWVTFATNGKFLSTDSGVFDFGDSKFFIVLTANIARSWDSSSP